MKCQIWPLATIIYVQLISDWTAKCLNIDCKIRRQFIFESSGRVFCKGERRLMGLIIGKSCAETVVGLENGDFIN